MSSKPLELQQHVFLFSILLFSLNSLDLVSSNIFNSTRDTDRQALISIKDQIQSSPFGNLLDHWDNSIHFCSWKGVNCNRTNKRAVALDLSKQQLDGTLSPYIGNLTFLKKLNLENNFLHGTIPREIGLLYQLQNLSLNDNFFHGEIPRNLTHCSDIRVINLARNNLEGEIPAELSSLSNLQELHLRRNNLKGSLPPALGNLSSLRVLNLSDNALEGGIPPDFGKLSKLETLVLSSNKLSGALPVLIFNLSKIEHFILASNLLNGSFPGDLGLNFPLLQTFYVGDNNFSGHIPESITNASFLEFLDISSNSFSGPLPLNMAHLKQLNRLDFSGNPVGSNGSFWMNFLTSMSNCTKLSILHLNDNNHTGVLPGSIANLSKELISLRLDGNHISGGIPESIGELTKLQGLYLSRNDFAGVIPSSIGNIPQLSILEMQENMLEGVIPDSLSNCNRLQKLNLSRNRLAGAISYELIGLSSLIDLSLARNQLTGPLPSSVGKLINLVSLDVSNNNLSGELPSTIGSCVVVQFLSLQGNSFGGSIQQSFGELRGLQFLDVSRNNLSGLIPASLTRFLLIQYVNLSFNALEGEVPNEGIFMNDTLFSITGNERLCGGLKSLNLPECDKESLSRKRKISLLILLFGVSFSFIILLLLAYIFRLRTKSPRIPRTEEASSDSLLGDHYPKLSYTELFQATDGFSPTNLIAVGRYSSVYKGILKGTEKSIAVKVLNLEHQGARKSFVGECEALRNIRHRNIVKIITSCAGSDFKGNEFKALIYELMPNGSLENWLHQIPTILQQPKNMDLIQRLNIAIDIASAIDYLHHCCEIQVIHRDIKPSNILLDDELCAHLGDFGSASSLLHPIDKTTHIRIRSSAIGIIGTVGYVALECGMGGRVSTLVDVYSYGILLLEMFTGKRPTDRMFKDNFNLHNYVKMGIPDQVMRISDPLLIADAKIMSHRAAEQSGRHNINDVEDCLALIFLIGIRCSAPLPRERMDIADALMQLKAIRDVFSKSN